MTTPEILRKKAEVWEAIFKQHTAYSDRDLIDVLRGAANEMEHLHQVVRKLTDDLSRCRTELATERGQPSYD